MSACVGTKEEQRDKRKWEDDVEGERTPSSKQGILKDDFYLIALIFPAQCKDPEHSLEKQQRSKVLRERMTCTLGKYSAEMCY